jgi:hypothetical protein
MTDIKFIKVKNTEKHALLLYDLLKKRSHNISHQTLPTYEDHKKFLANNPYRAWFLIIKNDVCVGSVYLLKSNSIGVFALKRQHDCLEASIQMVLEKYRPLPEIKSIRTAEFSINIHPNNRALITAAKTLKGKLVQKLILSHLR